MIKKKIGYISIYIAFLIITIEVSARLAFLLMPAERLWEDEEYGWRSIWVSRHQTSGEKIFYNFDTYDPSRGWRSKSNIRNMTVFGNKTLNTNSNGFRGDKDYSYIKNPNKLRIITIGDSFTFGDEVSDNETYSYYLQQMLPQVEVINMGVHGYGHDQMLILLREEGLKYKPDIVILGFLPMDMSRNLLAFRDYAKPKFVLDDGELKLTGVPIPSPENILKWDWANSKFLHLLAIMHHNFKRSHGLLKKDEEAITRTILHEIIESTLSINAIPIFAYLPSGNEINTISDFTDGEKYLFSICEASKKAKCMSTRQYFAEKISQKIIFKTKGHWGPEGHFTAAEAIKRYLVDSGYIDLL
ncbi:MAG: hypothetical protein C4560_07265 [Nitrospiraceae bacterium]|nr:MAG: hypothetical protein C4560_07265 [Nitrospiraceae bacterium]